MEIVYRGHKGEHREYYICQYCGSAFYDDTFVPLTKVIGRSTMCPVCGVLAMDVGKEMFESYVRKQMPFSNVSCMPEIERKDLKEFISTEGCADRAPDGTEK